MAILSSQGNLQGFVSMLIKIYFMQDPIRFMVFCVFLLNSTVAVAACDTIDEPRPCNIDNGARPLLEQAIVDQDGNITYEVGQDISACFTINTTNVDPVIKAFIDDCITDNTQIKTTNNIIQLCVDVPNVKEDHVIKVQLVGSYDASVSCFNPVYIKGIPDAINSIELEKTCDGIQESFDWPHGATSVKRTIYHSATLVDSTSIPFNLTSYNIPKSMFDSPGTFNIHLIGLNHNGPARNATVASIFIPPDVLEVKSFHLEYVNNTLTVVLTIKANTSCPYTREVYMATDCSVSPKDELLPVALNTSLDINNMTVLELPVDNKTGLQSNKRNCSIILYDQGHQIIGRIYGLDTTDIQRILYNVIDNALNFTCIFVKNSPATGCHIIINGKEHNISRDNIHDTSTSKTLPITSEGDQNVLVYTIKEENYIYYTTIKIVIPYNITNNTTGRNSTCVCEGIEEDTMDCDCNGQPSWVKIVVIVASAIIAVGVAVICILAGVCIAWVFHCSKVHKPQPNGCVLERYVMNNMQSQNSTTTVPQGIAEPQESPTSEPSTTNATEQKPLLHRQIEQETREGEAARACRAIALSAGRANIKESATDTESPMEGGAQYVPTIAKIVPMIAKINSGGDNAEEHVCNEVVFPKPDSNPRPMSDDYLYDGQPASAQGEFAVVSEGVFSGPF